MSREGRRNKRKLQLCLFLVIVVFLLAFLVHNQVLQDVFSPIPKGAVYRVETPDKVVAVTFDVVWEPGNIEKILDILDHYEIQATFFLTGSWLRKNATLARDITLHGHEIGQHSQNHKNLTELKDEDLTREFDLMEETLQEELSLVTNLFRPPLGELDQRICDYAKTRGYTTVLWSINPHDWLEPGVDKIVSRVVKNIHNGAIILFHTNSTQSIEALPLVIQSLKMKGYNTLTVSEMLELAEK